MQWSDITNRTGLVQDVEDITGLGATGVTGNTPVFQQICRFANDWNKKGTHYALLSNDGAELDDPAYSSLPSGTLTGLTTRDYWVDSAYKMLKIKLLNVSYGGTNYFPATPIDSRNEIYENHAVKDPGIDNYFSRSAPRYDLLANGFKLYPKFTQVEVNAGAKVYIEFFRSPREFATTSTDSYEPAFESQFHRLVSLGASFDYAKLYKPDLVPSLRLDIYGNGGNIKGILKELQDWYSSKQPSQKRITPYIANCK